MLHYILHYGMVREMSVKTEWVIKELLQLIAIAHM
jgi:hypothetical protein